MSRGLRVEERIPGVAYVVRLRKDQSIGWVVEIVLRNSVEKLIQLVSLDSNVLSTSLKNAFRELEVYSVTEIQIEMAAHNLLNKLSQITAPPQPQPKQQPAPASTTAPVPVAQPQQTPPATAPAPSAAQPTYTVQQPAVGSQQDIRDIVVKLVDKITELAARVASLETRVSQLESYLYK